MPLPTAPTPHCCTFPNGQCCNKSCPCLHYFTPQLLLNPSYLSAGVGTATDSRQLFDSRVHSSLVVAYSKVRHTRAERTLEYVLPSVPIRNPKLFPLILHAFSPPSPPPAVLITAVLYSAPSRKSTQERSQPNAGQTMWS